MKIIHKVLCWLGIHKWEPETVDLVNGLKIVVFHHCKHCGKEKP